MTKTLFHNLPYILVSSVIVVLILAICYPRIPREYIDSTKEKFTDPLNAHKIISTLDNEPIETTEAVPLRVDYQREYRARLENSAEHPTLIGVEELVPILGITLREILPLAHDQALSSKSGLLVTKIEKLSPATKSGLHINDLIRNIDAGGGDFFMWNT